MMIQGRKLIFDNCPRCKTLQGFEITIYECALARPGNGGMQIYCPNGHQWHYKEQKEIDELDKTRRERDRAVQDNAYLQSRLDDARKESEAHKRQASARKGQITRLKNRAVAGLCPCCNRSFENLQRHMKTKHPSYREEEVA